MNPEGRKLIVVGPRVLISPEVGEERTSAGLYLPPTVREKEEVQEGLIIKTGPGYILPEAVQGGEPWMERREPQYIPLEAREGDFAIFLKKDAVEIEYEGEKYLIVPHSAILALVRTEIRDTPDTLA